MTEAHEKHAVKRIKKKENLFILALENYEGTLLFVSHDREFVSSLATRIIEIKENEVVDFHGTYNEYLKSQGIVEA